MEPVQQQEPWVFFRTSQCVSGIPMVTTHYKELERKGLVSDKNRMRVVEQIGDTKHITLAAWPKEETPQASAGSGKLLLYLPDQYASQGVLRRLAR